MRSKVTGRRLEITPDQMSDRYEVIGGIKSTTEGDDLIEDTLYQLNKEELVAMCKDKGVDCKGTKEELIKNIRNGKVGA